MCIFLPMKRLFVLLLLIGFVYAGIPENANYVPYITMSGYKGYYDVLAKPRTELPIVLYRTDPILKTRKGALIYIPEAKVRYIGVLTGSDDTLVLSHIETYVCNTDSSTRCVEELRSYISNIGGLVAKSVLLVLTDDEKYVALIPVVYLYDEISVEPYLVAPTVYVYGENNAVYIIPPDDNVVKFERSMDILAPSYTGYKEVVEASVSYGGCIGKEIVFVTGGLEKYRAHILYDGNVAYILATRPDAEYIGIPTTSEQYVTLINEILGLPFGSSLVNYGYSESGYKIVYARIRNLTAEELVNRVNSVNERIDLSFYPVGIAEDVKQLGNKYYITLKDIDHRIYVSTVELCVPEEYFKEVNVVEGVTEAPTKEEAPKEAVQPEEVKPETVEAPVEEKVCDIEALDIRIERETYTYPLVPKTVDVTVCNPCDRPITGYRVVRPLIKGRDPIYFEAVFPPGCKTVEVQLPRYPYREYTVLYQVADDEKKIYRLVRMVTVSAGEMNKVCYDDVVYDVMFNIVYRCEEGCIFTGREYLCREFTGTDEEMEALLGGDLTKTVSVAETDWLTSLLVGGIGTAVLALLNVPLLKELAPFVPGGIATLLVAEILLLAFTYYLWKRCDAPFSEYAELGMIIGVPIIGDLPILAFVGASCLVKRLEE